MDKTQIYTIITMLFMSITMMLPVFFALLCIKESYLLPSVFVGMSLVSYFLFKTFKSI